MNQHSLDMTNEARAHVAMLTAVVLIATFPWLARSQTP